MASLDSSLLTTSRSWSRCHTNTESKRAKRRLKERRRSRRREQVEFIEREEMKPRDGPQNIHFQLQLQHHFHRQALVVMRISGHISKSRPERYPVPPVVRGCHGHRPPELIICQSNTFLRANYYYQAIFL